MLDKYKGTKLQRYFDWYQEAWITNYGSLDAENPFFETFEEFVLSTVPDNVKAECGFLEVC